MSDAEPQESEPSGGDDATKVAIACQGGGSHTAFTAGVLKRLLREWDDDRYELVGVSGTSGGAICATAAWYGLVTGERGDAVDTLDAIWDDIAATDPLDRWTNDVAVWTSRIEAGGFPLPEVSPYLLPVAAWARDELQATVEQHIDFEAIRALCADPDRPELVIGTVNVNAGEFETFRNEDVTATAILASAAVPDLFEAVEIHGHYHWDGLFSQNPPVHDLMSVPSDRKPEELWVVQVNPQERDGEPTSLEEIADRRNELAGNISLNQELRFVETVNEWVAAGHLPRDQYGHTEVRRLELDGDYHCSTKLDRDPAFVDELMAKGDATAREFLEGLRA
jgi:NTE family protein